MDMIRAAVLEYRERFGVLRTGFCALVALFASALAADDEPLFDAARVETRGSETASNRGVVFSVTF